MNAERMAERLEQHHAAFNTSAAVMLRRQHEAIQVLHDVLTEVNDRIKDLPAYAALTEDEECDIGGDTAELSYLSRIAEKALKDTEDLK